MLGTCGLQEPCANRPYMRVAYSLSMAAAVLVDLCLARCRYDCSVDVDKRWQRPQNGMVAITCIRLLKIPRSRMSIAARVRLHPTCSQPLALLPFAY